MEVEEVEEDANIPPENEIIRDVKYPNVYIRKVLKAEKRKNGKSKKQSRVYNSYHACVYCHKLVQHIPSHMKRHRNEQKVREVVAMYPEDRDVGEIRKKKMKCYLSNMLALREFGPCSKCYDWMKMFSLLKHAKTCAGYATQMDIDSYRPSCGVMITQVEIMQGKIKGNASDLLKKEVFTIMIRDDVTKVAQSDEINLTLGESWLRRNIDNICKRKYYSSSHMRSAARFFIEVRKLAHNEELSM